MDFIINFIQQIVKLISAQTSSSSDKGNEEEVVDAYKWLLAKMKDNKQTEVEAFRGPWLEPGKMYVFKYDPMYKERYEYYDKHPIVLMLGKMPAKEGFMNVGINISWYPPKARKYIIETIRKLYKPMYDAAIKTSPKQAKKQKSVPLDLFALKTALDQFGLSFAIRCYLPSKIKSPSVCICYEDWDKAIKLDQPKIFPEVQGGVPLLQIYKDFENYVKLCLKNKGEMKKKMDEAKKLNKYKFIK